MITEAQLQQIFTPLTGDPSPRVCRTLSGNINTILKVEANGRMYGLRIRSQEQVYRYEPDLMKEVFISWLLDPAHAGADDAEKARALSQLREAQRGAGRKSSGIEPCRSRISCMSGSKASRCGMTRTSNYTGLRATRWQACIGCGSMPSTPISLP